MKENFEKIRQLPLTKEDVNCIKTKSLPEGNDWKVEFESFIKKYMSEDQVNLAGVVVKVLRKEGTIFSGEYGEKKKGSGEKVTETTPFMWASMTKSLTSTMVLEVIARGLGLSLDTPIIKIFPELELKDQELAKKITIRNSLAMTIGFSRVVEYYFKHYKTTELIQALRKMTPPTYPGEFQYSNVMYILSGFVAARVWCAKTYPGRKFTHEEEYALAMKDLVFTPLKMNNTVLTVEEARKRNPAYPHIYDFKGKLCESDFEHEKFVEGMGPSGAGIGPITDFIRYLQAELDNGAVDGKQIFEKNTFLERRKPITEAYGLGLGIGDLHGLKVISHNGGLVGYSTVFVVFPEQDLAVAMLMNTSGIEITTIFLMTAVLKLLEVLYNLKPTAEDKLKEALKTHKATIENNLQTILFDPRSMQPAIPFLGAYVDDRLGVLRFYEKDEKYYIQCTQWASQVGINQVRKDELVAIDPPSLNLLRPVMKEKSLILAGEEETYSFRRISLDLKYLKAQIASQAQVLKGSLTFFSDTQNKDKIIAYARLLETIVNLEKGQIIELPEQLDLLQAYIEATVNILKDTKGDKKEILKYVGVVDIILKMRENKKGISDKEYKQLSAVWEELIPMQLELPTEENKKGLKKIEPNF